VAYLICAGPGAASRATAEEAGITANAVGAVARATLSVQSTATTARNTAGAGARGAGARAAVGVHHTSARVCDTAVAVVAGLARGAAPAGPAAAVIATHLVRAVRRAATAVKTGLARGTTNADAVCRIARLTLAGIAGTRQADRTTNVSCRAASCAVETGLPLRTPTIGAADLTIRAAAGAQTGFVGITASAGAAVVRTTISVPIARRAGIIAARSVVTAVAGWTAVTGAGCHVTMLALGGIAWSSQTDQAADVGSRAARSVQARLARGTADAVTCLVGGATRATYTSLAGTAADAVAAGMRRATQSALVLQLFPAVTHGPHTPLWQI